MQLRHAPLSASLWLFTACANLFGGQSGDDGDVVDRGGEPTAEPPHPEDPDEDCYETRELDATSPTSLGKTPAELIAELTPTSVLLHWVAFESPQFDVTYAPGPSETKLAFSVSLRNAAEDVTSEDVIRERMPTSEAATNMDCGGTRVVAPVWIDLEARDGALDERFEGTVVLYGNATAEIFATVSVEDLGGTFQFNAASSKSNTQGWKPSTLTLNAELWPGGSAGTIYPEFVPTSTSEDGRGETTSPPPIAPPDPSDVAATPMIPEHWAAIAVWPRLEQCSLGVARTPLDAVVGVSAQEVIEALAAHIPTTLSVTKNATALSSTLLAFEVEPSELPDLLCLSVDHRKRQLSFAVPTTLQAAGDGETPARIDVSFDLSITAQTDNQNLTIVHFSRTLRETAYPISKTALTATTGLALEGLNDDYSEFWWTWYGNLALETSTNSAAYDAHLVVAAPSSREREEVAEQTADGGSGFGVSYDSQSVHLPGDVVFKAEISE